MRLEVDTAKMWMGIACFAFRRAVKANGQSYFTLTCLPFTALFLTGDWR